MTGKVSKARIRSSNNEDVNHVHYSSIVKAKATELCIVCDLDTQRSPNTEGTVSFRIIDGDCVEAVSANGPGYDAEALSF